MSTLEVMENSITESTGDAPFIPETASPHEMRIANFSQVLFPAIPDVFPPDSDITVTYVLTDVIEPSSRDWIGLFRVGWSSPRDYSTYMWAPKPGNADANGNRSQSVTFQAYQLPGDDAEFYQFCFVTKQGSVRGASIPFQFRVSTENDCLIAVEDENGMIILKTKSDDLEEKLSQIQSEKQTLQETFDKLTEIKEALQKDLEIASETLSATQDKLNISEEKNLALQKDIEEAQQQHNKITKRLAKADSRIEKTKEQLATAEGTIVALQSDIERLEKRIEEAVQGGMAKEQAHQETINKQELMLQEIEKEKMSLYDQIKDLALIKEESQRSSVTAEKEREETLQAAAQAKEHLSMKLRRYKDERDLFREQLTESEMSRRDNLQKIESLTDKLDAEESKVKSAEEEMRVTEDKMKEVTKKLEDLEKRHKREVIKTQDYLRNSMEQTNAMTTAKQLLATELRDVTATRDQLLEELNQIKKEKESLSEDLKGMQSMARALQCQLETAEEKQEQSEACLNEHQRLVLEERKRTEAMEQEMHDRIVTLQRQLEEADLVVAKATDSRPSDEPSVPKSDRVTQTRSTSAENVENHSNEMKKVLEEKEQAVNDLKTQIEDYKTRLGMGATAYKEKYLECTKLEKKLRRMKQATQAKEASERATSPVSAAMATRDEDEQPQGWRSKFEKLIMAIADPDAEEKEQALQLRQQLESLQKDFDNEKDKHQKYKRLFSEAKKKMESASSLSEGRERSLRKSLKEMEGAKRNLMDENNMLKAQLKEFVKKSTDSTVRNVMTSFDSGSDELDSSLDATSAYSSEHHEDELQFMDAPGTPMRVESLDRGSSEQSQSSSDTDDYTLTQGGTLSNFNMCSEAARGGVQGDGKVEGATGRPSSSPRDIKSTSGRKQKVISRQPIRSPPMLGDLMVTSRSPTDVSKPETSMSSQTRKRSGKAKSRSKGKGKKSTVKPVM